MREHLENCVSPTAHRGYTWEQWKMLAEIAAEIDWQCDFDAQGKCKMARIAPVSQPSLGQIVGYNDRNCCFHCSANKGFLEKVPKEAVPHVLASMIQASLSGLRVKVVYCRGNGGRMSVSGSPAGLNSQPLRTLLEQFQSVTATSPWRQSLSDKQIAELNKQLRRDGMFKSSTPHTTGYVWEFEERLPPGGRVNDPMCQPDPEGSRG